VVLGANPVAVQIVDARLVNGAPTQVIKVEGVEPVVDAYTIHEPKSASVPEQVDDPAVHVRIACVILAVEGTTDGDVGAVPATPVANVMMLDGFEVKYDGEQISTTEKEYNELAVEIAAIKPGAVQVWTLRVVKEALVHVNNVGEATEVLKYTSQERNDTPVP
jgi:hypothetical protein